MTVARAIRLTKSASRALVGRQPVAVSHHLPLSTRVAAGAYSVAARAFSVSVRRFTDVNSGVSLSGKLQQEIQYEKEDSEANSTPEFLKTFLAQGVWSIEDIPGNGEVALTRTFGNEQLRMMFAVEDIQPEEENFEGEDSAEEVEEGNYPIRVALSISKKNAPGSLSFDMICSEGQFVVENITYYGDAKMGTDLTAEADWKRRGLYIGPKFESLDMAVQEEFEKYLQERGVHESVGLFIPEYAEYKERQEYLAWLGKVKKFIDV